MGIVDFIESEKDYDSQKNDENSQYSRSRLCFKKWGCVPGEFAGIFFTTDERDKGKSREFFFIPFVRAFFLEDNDCVVHGRYDLSAGLKFAPPFVGSSAARLGACENFIKRAFIFYCFCSVAAHYFCVSRGRGFFEIFSSEFAQRGDSLDPDNFSGTAHDIRQKRSCPP